MHYWSFILRTPGQYLYSKRRWIYGLVLGSIVINFHMVDTENKVFNKIEKFSLYLYIDNILIVPNDINEINMLYAIFQKNSVLNFTLN